MTVPMPTQLFTDAQDIAAIEILRHSAGQTIGAWSQHPKFSTDSSVSELLTLFGDRQLSRADLLQLGVGARA